MRLVTYNIHGAQGMDGRRSVARIADALQQTGAEIACLQEVHRRLPWSGMQDQPARLARRTGMKIVFQNNFELGVGGFGNALLTVLPVLSRRDHRLPNAGERARVLRMPEGRGLLETVLQTPGGPLAVLTTHWSLDAEDRLEAAEITAAVVRGLDVPVLLAGDFNATAESREMERLREGSGLEDAAAGAPEPTYPADAPRVQIDVVLGTPDLPVRSARVVDTLASDHRPVVVEW